MKKLTLEHLKIEYGGKVDLNRKMYKEKNVNLQNCSIHYNETCAIYYIKYKGVTYGMHDIKPHRRPLSDLTKEIECNGERFVPIYIIFEMWARNKKPKHQDYYINVTPNFIYCSHPSTSEVLCISIGNYIKENSYWCLEKLYEWHFAIDIPEHLYININDLNYNPLK